jgi:hypothetical protein
MLFFVLMMWVGVLTIHYGLQDTQTLHEMHMAQVVNEIATDFPALRACGSLISRVRKNAIHKFVAIHLHMWHMSQGQLVMEIAPECPALRDCDGSLISRVRKNAIHEFVAIHLHRWRMSQVVKAITLKRKNTATEFAAQKRSLRRVPYVRY